MLTQLSNFSGALSWVETGGYLLTFAGMLAEGPIVTAAASFAAALGFFKLWIIFILAFFGDVLPDLVYYFMGYLGRITLIEKYSKRFATSADKIKKIELGIKANPIKTLVAIKLTPFLPVPGLIAVGTTRLKLRKFISIIVLITIPRVLLFMILGYYFGRTYDTVSHRVADAYLILVIILVFWILYYIYKKILARISKNIEDLK